MIRSSLPLRTSKILAGLTRLDRMLLLRYDAEVAEVVAVDGEDMPWPAPACSSSSRCSTARAAPRPTRTRADARRWTSTPSWARIWDFVVEDYVVPEPDDGDTHLVAIEVQHGAWASQTAIVVKPGV